jgi:hypothetical protein
MNLLLRELGIEMITTLMQFLRRKGKRKGENMNSTTSSE